MAVLLETSIGDIVIDLKLDEAPKTCLNFLKLCKIKYFNNHLFFRVQKDYIAQTGDPRNDGTGGASIFAKLPGLAQRYFKDEISPAMKHNKKGIVAMANEKPHQNGSQFYITLRDRVEHLDGKHTIFGNVAEGFDVLDKMSSVMVDEHEAPFQNIRIWHTEILEDPLPDPEGLEAIIPSKSPEPIRDEEFKKIEDAEDEAELNEKMAKTLAKSQATTLELLHDLPDAEIEVADNDLFVTCLNPVTQDGDLELIFSRFGPIKSCEIVRDWKTGDSLQYGFITFENARDCEEAYFKMHDCVIDDRRIVVNFSQSVAKLWNKFHTGARMTAADAREAAQGAKGERKGKGKGKGRGGMSGDKELLTAKEEQARSTKHQLVFEGKDHGRGGREERGGRDKDRERARERPKAETRSRSRDRGHEKNGSRDKDGGRDKERERKARSRSRDRRRR